MNERLREILVRRIRERDWREAAIMLGFVAVDAALAGLLVIGPFLILVAFPLWATRCMP